MGLVTIIYCLRFETSLFVASYDSQGYGVGIRPRLHTGCLTAASIFSLYNVGTDRVGNTVSNISSIVRSVCVAKEAFLPRRSLATSILTGFIILALSGHITVPL
jgi:hypothetical protein